MLYSKIKTFLECLAKGKNPSIILGDRLFLTQPSNGESSYQLRVGQRLFSIEQSLSWSSFENRLLEENIEEVDSALDDKIQSEYLKLVKEMHDFENSENRVARPTPNSFEEYLLVNVLAVYLNQLENPLRRHYKPSLRKEGRANAKRVLEGVPYLGSLFPGKAMVLFNNAAQVYKKDGFSVRNGNKLFLAAHCWRPETTLTIEEIVQRYSQLVDRKITELAHQSFKNRGQIQLYINSKKNQLKIYEKSLEKAREAQRKKSIIFYEQNGEGHYAVLVRMQPYAIFYKNKYYYFHEPVTLKSKIRYDGKYAKASQPRVVSPPNYQHPFVYLPDNTWGQKICFDGGRVFTRKNIRLGSIPLRSFSDTFFGLNLVAMLIEAVYGLQAGYIEGVNPARGSLENFSFRVVSKHQLPEDVAIRYVRPDL